MRLSFAAYLLLLASCEMACAMRADIQKETEEKQEWAQLIQRFSDQRSINLITSEMWSLTHGGERTEVERVMNLLTPLFDPSTKQDASLAKKLGSAKEFKDKIAVFLNSKDDVVAGFAAIILGISGDLRYAPAIAKLLDKKDPPEDSKPLVSRGRAATALSLMGAREYVPKLVVMLRSRNNYDRSGAAIALGQLHAKEHAKEVADLLNNPEFRDDDSPIYALMEMGVGAEYAGEFAKVLRGDFIGETVDTAAYALAKLGAREYASDIAKLLNKEFRKGNAAKALAVMGATEYADAVALMLEDKNALNRKDALLALGVMRAMKYLPQVATHLKDPEAFVHIDAAYALVLMDADKYASQVVALVQNAYQENLYLTGDFHPLVEEEVVKIRKRFAESFLKMKAKSEIKGQK
jgi:HEAT repeat protein